MDRDFDSSGEDNPAGGPIRAVAAAADAAEAFRRAYRLPEDDEALLAECRVSKFKAPGPGGQHKNTTMSAVRLVHEPSGLVVIGRRERSQLRNLKDALARLRERLAKRLARPKKRRKTKPSAASRERRIDDKKKRGSVKRLRTSQPTDE